MTVSAIINSSFQHLLAKIPKSFTIERSHGWEINQGGALEQLGFEVLLKDVHSLTPVAFCRDHSLLLTVSLTENRPTKELERLLKNYLRLLTYERSKHSLAEIIFGTGSPALFPNSLHRPSPSSPGYPFFLPPCTNLCISSIVDAPGPIKILSSNGSPAAMKGLVKEKQPSVSAHFPTLRMTQNLCSSAQLPEAKSVQYRFLRPEMSRRKRLETFLAEKNFSVPLLNFSQFSAGDDKAVSHNPSANDSIGKVSLFSVDEPCALIQTAAPTERSIEICNPATDNDVQSLQSVYSRPSQDRCDDLLLANISPMGNRPRTKQRPVSASMLRAKLPIRHPLCHKSREDFEVVVSPAKQIRPYSAHSKYQRQQQARKTGKEEKYLPMFAPPPPKEAFVGPPFLRHFGKLRDLIGRKYAGLGPQQRPGPGDMIHGSSSNLNLEGPWKW